MAGNLNWNQIRVDFHDANQSMATGAGALSQAGTVFGQLRKSILDEEQRAVDNAFREKKFNEDVRQFGLNYALSKDKFAEDVRHNKADEQYNQDSLAETRLHHRNIEGIDRERLSLSRAQNAREENKFALEEQQRARFEKAWDVISGQAFQREKTAYDNALEEASGVGQAQKAFDENEQWMKNFNDTVAKWESGQSTEYVPIAQREALNQEAYDRGRQRQVLQANLDMAKKKAEAWKAEHPEPVNMTPRDNSTKALMLMKAVGDPKVALAYMQSQQESAARAADKALDREVRLVAAQIKAGTKNMGGQGGGTSGKKGNSPEEIAKGYSAYGVPSNDAKGLAMVQGAMNDALARQGAGSLSADTMRGILFDAFDIQKSVLSSTPGADIVYRTPYLQTRNFDQVAKALRNPDDKSIPSDIRKTAEWIRKKMLDVIAQSNSQLHNYGLN